MTTQLLFCHLWPVKSFHLISVDDDLASFIYVLSLGYSNVIYRGFQCWRNFKRHRTLQHTGYLKLLKSFSFPASGNHYMHNTGAPHALWWRPWSTKNSLCCSENKYNKGDDLCRRQIVRLMNELLRNIINSTISLPRAWQIGVHFLELACPTVIICI